MEQRAISCYIFQSQLVKPENPKPRKGFPPTTTLEFTKDFKAQALKFVIIPEDKKKETKVQLKIHACFKPEGKYLNTLICLQSNFALPFCC